jgi:hypothetical protein
MYYIRQKIEKKNKSYQIFYDENGNIISKTPEQIIKSEIEYNYLYYEQRNEETIQFFMGEHRFDEKTLFETEQKANEVLNFIVERFDKHGNITYSVESE